MQLIIKGIPHEVTRVQAKSTNGNLTPAKTVITFIDIDKETGKLISYSVKASEYAKVEKGKLVELPVKIFVANNQAYYSLVE